MCSYRIDSCRPALLCKSLISVIFLAKHKSKGLDLNSLLIGLLSYKLTENFSIKEAGKWLNQEEILDILNLEQFHERVLYRTLELLGRNREEILSDILDSLFSVYDFEVTNINLDWTSIVLYGNKNLSEKSCCSGCYPCTC